MLISLTWLQTLLVTPQGDTAPPLAPDTVAEALTALGLEVEGMIHHGAGLESIVVGEVRAVNPHPNAERLRSVQLFDGQTTLDVVCGAPNVPPSGGKVAFAPVGTELPGGLQIAPREVRGVESRGMICSEDELDIGPDGDGIIVLPSDWPAGSRLVDQVAGVQDTVIEVAITPNRPDALGHVGVARDLAVKLGLALRTPAHDVPTGPVDPALVDLRDPNRCGRYLGFAFEDVGVGPSPLWMRVRLHRVGLRPINNVVDITNFVLMEWGQPQHAFDRDQLARGGVVVRPATAGEAFTSLDGRELELSPDDLVIADAVVPQALAGVMGGASSGVGPGTSRILLEAAWFAPPCVRATARRYGFGTDSSYRFERGVDHGVILEEAALRSRALLVEIAGARPVGHAYAEGNRPPAVEIPLRPARTTLVLGVQIPEGDARRILEGLGVEVDTTDPSRWMCRAPTHRPDLGREVDLIEELVRHHGLDHLPAVASLPTSPEAVPPPSPAARRRSRVLQALTAAGFHEIVAYAFTSPDKLAPFAGETPLDRVVTLANPMRQQMAAMRTHLLPGLLDALAVNLARHGREVALFEVGRTYAWPPSSSPVAGPTGAIDAQLPREDERAAVLACAGTVHASSDAALQEVAGALMTALARLGLPDAAIRPAGDVAHLHPGVQARIVISGTVVGTFGEVHPDVLDVFDLPGRRPAYGELRLDLLPDAEPTQMAAIPRFPSTARDVSLEVPIDLPAAVVLDAFLAAQGPLAEGPALGPGDTGRGAVEVIEDYRGKNLPAGRRSLLLRLHYRSHERTVTDDEVQSVHAEILERAVVALQGHADVRVR